MSKEDLSEVKTFTRPSGVTKPGSKDLPGFGVGFSNCDASCSGTSGGGTCCTCDFVPREPLVKKG